MKYAMWVVAVLSAWAFTGCTAVSKYDRLVITETGAEFKPAEIEKGVTPTEISEPVLVRDVAGNPLYYELVANVDKNTDMLSYTPKLHKPGRIVTIPRQAHGVFRIPANYVLVYGMTDFIFVDSLGLKRCLQVVNLWNKHFFKPTVYASVDGVLPGWKGVGVVEEDHSISLAGVLPEAQRAEHAKRMIGGVLPAVTATRTLPAPAQASAANAVTLTPAQAAAFNAAQGQ